MNLTSRSRANRDCANGMQCCVGLYLAYYRH